MVSFEREGGRLVVLVGVGFSCEDSPTDLLVSFSRSGDLPSSIADIGLDDMGWWVRWRVKMGNPTLLPSKIISPTNPNLCKFSAQNIWMLFLFFYTIWMLF